MHPNTTQLPQGFFGLGIAPKLLQILDKLNYKTPTPIQLKSIPIGIEGKDLVGIAQTGTGKTLAFGIPMIQRIAQTKGVGLIVLPTRELAEQVQETMAKIGGPIGLRTVLLIGGASMHMQKMQIRKKPHVIIATPGRLNDHIDQKSVSLKNVATIVLDEADRMLDMGFEPQIKKILANVPKERQTMLFSATMPANIMKIAKSYMELPVRIEIARAGTAAKNVSQEVIMVAKGEKIRLLSKLLEEHRGTVLVFARTKHGAKKIAASVRSMGHPSAEIHSNRTQAQRKDAIEGFKNGRYRVLVATDIAARGIDVSSIELVINYDLPDQTEDYVHRIGRTGRAGQSGQAISFATPDQKRDIRDIERLMKMMLPVSKAKDLPEELPRVELPKELTMKRSGSRSKSGFSRDRSSRDRSDRDRSSRDQSSRDRRPPKRAGRSDRGSTSRPPDRGSTSRPRGKGGRSGSSGGARKIRVTF